ncbi:hypothetical protein KCU71_g125, partial [Aureobasidium melanogenum]
MRLSSTCSRRKLACGRTAYTRFLKDFSLIRARHRHDLIQVQRLNESFQMHKFSSLLHIKKVLCSFVQCKFQLARYNRLIFGDEQT